VKEAESNLQVGSGSSSLDFLDGESSRFGVESGRVRLPRVLKRLSNCFFLRYTIMSMMFQTKWKMSSLNDKRPFNQIQLFLNDISLLVKSWSSMSASLAL